MHSRQKKVRKKEGTSGTQEKIDQQEWDADEAVISCAAQICNSDLQARRCMLGMMLMVGGASRIDMARDKNDK